MRLIDADNVNWGRCPVSGYSMKEWLAEQPAIDAVPVVRCWNCDNGLRSVDGYVRCSHPSGRLILMKGSDFCSYGEQRKEAEGDG